MKICSSCRFPVESKDFYADIRKKDGLSSWCKKCQKEYAKERRRKKKDAWLVRSRDRAAGRVTLEACDRCQKLVDHRVREGRRYYCIACIAHIDNEAALQDSQEAIAAAGRSEAMEAAYQRAGAAEGFDDGIERCAGV